MMIKKVLSNVELVFSFCIAESFRGKASLFCLLILRKNKILHYSNHKVSAIIYRHILHTTYRLLLE